MGVSFSKSLILVLVLIASLATAAVWGLNRFVPGTQKEPPAIVNTNQAQLIPNTALESPSATPIETQKQPPEAPAQESTGPPITLENSYIGELNLIIPVRGVKRDQLIDTFSDARSDGRVHDAIDIPAPANTPVLASADGQIVKLFQSERGGITIYQSSRDRKLIFYYAHLSSYAPGLEEGQQVRQGDTIAYVGDTGNAGPGNFHLHFSIAIVSDSRRYWEGTNINPYPLLHH